MEDSIIRYENEGSHVALTPMLLQKLDYPPQQLQSGQIYRSNFPEMQFQIKFWYHRVATSKIYEMMKRRSPMFANSVRLRTFKVTMTNLSNHFS
jgi:hypothetical protein